MQHAQPITLGFVFMAYFQMFRRDITRLIDTYERMDLCPLGSCALAGTTLPISRHRTAKLLGFSAPSENAMDSVSDRDYSIEFLSDASISMMHLSAGPRNSYGGTLRNFPILPSTTAIAPAAASCPRRKIRIWRNCFAVKWQGLWRSDAAADRDEGNTACLQQGFQEDKESLFDAVDTWKASIQIFANMLEKTEFRMDQIEKQFSKGFLNATDIAEHFAKQGIPFRQAHSIVGQMVKACEHKGCDLKI